MAIGRLFDSPVTAANGIGKVLEEAGIEFVKAEPWGQKVAVDGKLITGQNQQSASEYSIAFLHLLFGLDPVLVK